jgi:hypothetical protein
MQMATFQQLKVTGLLCSRFSASVQRGRRFFTLVGESEKLPNGREEMGEGEPMGQLQQLPASATSLGLAAPKLLALLSRATPLGLAGRVLLAQLCRAMSLELISSILLFLA